MNCEIRSSWYPFFKLLFVVLASGKMEINLDWDLFIIAFSLVIIAYTFMIGKYQSLKIILSSYISILTADGIGNLVEKYLIGDDPAINVFVAQGENQSLIVLKIAIFVILTILLATRGGFGIVISQEKSRFFSFVTTFVYGILSAGLIISTILIYVSGSSMVEATSIFVNNPLTTIEASSRLVRVMTENYNIWFSMPAVAFIFTSFLGEPTTTAQE